MPVSLEYGHARAGWQIGDKGLAVFVPVPFLGGASEELLYSDTVECLSQSEDWLHVENEAFIIIATKVLVANNMEAVTLELYQRLLTAVGSQQILRIWNYVPRINEWESGDENYRSFCSGRAKAFATQAAPDNTNFPAASAVGCNGDEVITILIAAKSGKAHHFENPLQCPAYEYPPQYGANAPAFARATSWEKHGSALYISGTSSVSGHETAFPLDIDGQLRVTAQNLYSILNEARMRGVSNDLAKPGWLKAYVRKPHDASKVEAFLAEENWLVDDRFSIVQADICRRELLVEIELSWLDLKANTSSIKSRFST
ncbi:hypothetical protein [Rubellicoccus peritrichatus]|uniref:Chorismatase FkbO/Hyg5-like N-terminal domain-containing protein n=1 Tax=Rubellicoccus peritrichatus TaxID=3080537 RepID=A0AAQ3QWV8_9BACT|nr:hypothetical protein [Puniceicoccus sp. CR14]WOO42317.1 hypothetical protein RZN69_04390 [Puniceicoccus sp. CR14]